MKKMKQEEQEEQEELNLKGVEAWKDQLGQQIANKAMATPRTVKGTWSIEVRDHSDPHCPIAQLPLLSCALWDPDRWLDSWSPYSSTYWAIMKEATDPLSTV